MIRMALIIAMTLVCLSALAGTWKDDFARQELGLSWDWAQTGSPIESWKIKNGVCVGEVVAMKNIFVRTSYLVSREDTWKDYTLEVKTKGVEKLDGFGQSWWGIVARYQGPPEAGVMIAFSPQENRLQVIRQVAKNFGQFLLVNRPFSIKMDTWYLMKIVVKGSDIETYVNDHPIHSFKDTDFPPDFRIPSGRVALFTQNMRVHFDDVRITGPDIPDGSPLPVHPKSTLATTWGKIKASK